MQINLTKEQLIQLARDYEYPKDDVLRHRMQAAAQRGYMNLEDLLTVTRWKWRGSRPTDLAEQNTEAEVREISKVAFSAEGERLRIGALLSLRGVSWPIASVILHYAYPDRYPIVDVRVMKTVGGEKGYTLDRWLQFVDLCRTAASKYGISLRDLDKALWQADKGKRSYTSPTK